MDAVDQTRYRGFMNELFRAFEQQYLIRRTGVLDEEQWGSFANIVRDFASLPGAQTYLRDRRGWYVPSFITFIEDLVDVDLSGGTRMLDQYVERSRDSEGQWAT